MGTKPKLKESFDVESKHGAFYTGGNIEWLEDTIYCQNNASISLLNTENGLVEKIIGEENSDDADVIQTFVTDGQRIISSHKSGLLKMWNHNGEVEKMWKYIHQGPIAKLALKGDNLASGGSDGVVRIWDLQFQICKLGLKGCQGVTSVVEFHPQLDQVFASGDDGPVNCFELARGKLSSVYRAHYSKVTSLVFGHDGEHFMTCGRDKVLILWKFDVTEPLRTIPLQEAVEAMVGLPSKFKLPGGFQADPTTLYAATAGEKGVVRVWDVKRAKEVFAQTNSLVSPATDGGIAVTHLKLGKKSKSLALVTSDQNIVVHHLKSFACLKQFIGFSDEILDIAYVGDNDAYLAVATNSNDIKLYEDASMNCVLLKGHTDLVLSLSTSRTDPDLMLSSGKDNTVRLWLLQGSTMSCVAVGLRHTASVGSVAFSRTSCDFGVSVGQDTCLKLWEIKAKSSLYCAQTTVAHQKEINCVTVAPNDRLIATASQDKTAKLWTGSLEPVGTLRGHKRGVWSVRFSPVDQVAVTSSADCTIKLWSVADLSCLKTLEGHDASVLRAEFVSSGAQILSAGADGLLKLYSIKTSECVCTMEEHEARVWAMAVRSDESRVVTGGGDSLLIKWRDVTEERIARRAEEAEEMARQEQKLSNYLQNEDFLKALRLALRLDRPLQALRIVQRVIETSDAGLADTVRSLRNDHKEALLRHAINWNMNSRYCHPAQLIINLLMGELQTGEFRPVGLSSAVEGALPYTERHFKRLTNLMQEMQFINYTINCMKPHIKKVN